MNPERLLRAGAFMEAHLCDPFDLEEVADVAAMSLRSLQRHFADAVGESLASFVRGRRLTLAAQQLVAGHGDILSLALDCQFGSHEAFTRAFARHFFMTPSEYRQQGSQQHFYYRPVLGEAMLGELGRQRQRPPRIVHQPAHLLWGLGRTLTGDEMAGPALLAQVAQLQADLHSLFGHAIRPRLFYFKTAPQQCRYYRLLLAIDAGRGAPPAGLDALTLPAGYRASFWTRSYEQLLPVFFYHCFAQWIFHSGWHFADAPVELHLPDERQAALGLTLPVRTTPSPGYQLW